MRERLAKAELPEDIRKEAERELGRLEKLPSAQPEYNVIRTWLEYVIELPWTKQSEDTLDLKRAREVLDEDHFGIAKVKERIIEQLAILKLNPEAKAPILCLVGAPGVGKTSLGQSIARALGRKFERMSLGGMHDEAELRGHRRTYIGALAGPADSGHAAGGFRESGADAGRSGQARARFPRRSGGGAAGSAGSGAEQDFPRQLSGFAVRFVEGAVHHHGQHAGYDSGAVAGPDGDPAAFRLQRRREDADRAALPAAAAVEASRV